jgi:hypothetical protein
MFCKRLQLEQSFLAEEYSAGFKDQSDNYVSFMALRSFKSCTDSLWMQAKLVKNYILRKAVISYYLNKSLNEKKSLFLLALLVDDLSSLRKTGCLNRKNCLVHLFQAR